MHPHDKFHQQFNKRLDADFRTMNKRVRQIHRFALVASLASIAGYICVLGFLAWVIVKMMQHFQVI